MDWCSIQVVFSIHIGSRSTTTLTMITQLLKKNDWIAYCTIVPVCSCILSTHFHTFCSIVLLILFALKTSSDSEALHRYYEKNGGVSWFWRRCVCGVERQWNVWQQAGCVKPAEAEAVLLFCLELPEKSSYSGPHEHHSKPHSPHCTHFEPLHSLVVCSCL